MNDQAQQVQHVELEGTWKAPARSSSHMPSANSHHSIDPPFDQEKLSRLLQEYLPIIRRIAASLAIKNPFCLDVEDLTSAGTMGLLSALKRYDPTRDIKFRTFAEYRIRGMMLDEIRAMDWVPRSVRARREQIRQAVNEYVQKNGVPPSTEVIAKQLGLNQEELEGLGGCDPRLISLDEPVGQAEDACTLRDMLPDIERQDPFTECADAEMKKALNAALIKLSLRQQEVLQLYYHTGLTMKEIGSRMGLTESGVCRVHSGALRQLRGELANMEEEATHKYRPKNLRRVQPNSTTR